jgi:hypothetical protein
MSRIATPDRAPVLPAVAAHRASTRSVVIAGPATRSVTVRAPSGAADARAEASAWARRAAAANGFGDG